MSFFEPPFQQTKYNVLSLGAGVQSSCLALMAAKGEITPMPDFAVFADTQAEPAEVYKWLDWLETQLPFPVYRVTKGNLTNESLKVRVKTKSKYGNGISYIRRLIPMFGKKADGSVVPAIGRSCTADFKIKPIFKKIRELCKIRHGQKDITVTQWIGISYDEMQRMKASPNKWSQNRWPLIEKKMHREDCIKWMADNGYPEPPRSACYYCPFHSNEEWIKLKTEDPVHFQKAVEFDRTIRDLNNQHPGGMEMGLFLHRKCKPLEELDFQALIDEKKKKKSKVEELDFDFKSECEGMCGL
jgi:hypothetical protein